MYCPNGNIVNFSHRSQILSLLPFLCWHHSKMPFKPMDEKNSRNFPLFMRDVDPHLIHQSWAHPTRHPKQQLGHFTHLSAPMPQSPHWLQWDALFPSQKLPLPMRWSPSHLHTSSLDPADPLVQTAPDPISRFSPVHQTDRETDNSNNKSSPRAFGKSMSSPLTAANRLTCFVCY